MSGSQRVPAGLSALVMKAGRPDGEDTWFPNCCVFFPRDFLFLRSFHQLLLVLLQSEFVT